MIVIDHHIHHSSIYASVYPLYPSSVCWLIINSEHLCHLSQLSIFIPFFLVFVSISNQTYPILSAFSVAFPHHQLHISVLEIPWYEPLKDMESCFGIWHVIIYIFICIYIYSYIYIYKCHYTIYISNILFIYLIIYIYIIYNIYIIYIVTTSFPAFVASFLHVPERNRKGHFPTGELGLLDGEGFLVAVQ